MTSLMFGLKIVKILLDGKLVAEIDIKVTETDNKAAFFNGAKLEADRPLTDAEKVVLGMLALIERKKK